MDQRRRILVADDDPVARMVVRRRLEADGYDVVLVEDGKAALAEVARERPALAILDMLMPNVDGMGVVADLRSRPETARLPVIFISAQGAIVTAQAARIANAFFPKPIDFPALMTQIETLLKAAPVAAPGPFVAPVAPTPLPVLPTTGIAGGGPVPAGVVALVGAKGGVGTTTVAANLAVVLAETGRRTVLVETAAFHGTLPTVLGVPARRRMDRLPLAGGQPLDPATVGDTLLPHPSGLQVLLGPSGIQSPPSSEGAIALLEALKGLAEHVVVDVTDAVGVWGQVSLRMAERIWVVATPEPAAVERAEALIELLELWGVRPQTIQLLVNQTSPAMTMEPPAIAEQTGREVVVYVPAAPEACAEATRRRLPLVALAPELPASRTLRAVAGTTAAVLADARA